MNRPHDEFVGQPEYPAPWTTNRPLEGLRDEAQAKIVSLSPDVCLTPVGNSVVPIPYPVVDDCGDDNNYTPTVNFTRQKAMVLRSNTTCVHGDAPGSRKGVKSGTVGDICEPIGHASQVRAEGSPVIRHLDRFHMNKRNTVGEAIFVRDLGVYGAPVDTDPLPGSLLLAEAPTGILTDAIPVQGFVGPETTTETTTIPGSTTGTGVTTPGGAPEPPRPPQRSSTLQRLGRLGRVLGPLNWILNGGTPPGFDERMLAGGRADEVLQDITPTTPAQEEIFDASRQRIEDHIFDSYMDPFAGVDEDYIQAEREHLERELERQRQAEADAGTRSATDTASDTVRIDEDYDQRCPILQIEFRTHGDPAEFSRQLEEQEARLNRMPPTEYLARRAPISGVSRRDILAARRQASLPHQARVRAEYVEGNRQTFINEQLELNGGDMGAARSAWEDHLDGLAATHELDLIAGGYEHEISGMGGKAENSSIGPQWRAQRRSGALDRHARELQENGCPFIRVDLIAE